MEFIDPASGLKIFAFKITKGYNQYVIQSYIHPLHTKKKKQTLHEPLTL